jgi:tetratricopeptide (TPR) repeat protein
MSKMPFEFEPENEAVYESLISLIENNQGRLAPIIVGCDNRRLRELVIERYERDAKFVKIQPYRIMLGEEPSVRSGIAKIVEQDEYLQGGGEAVFTVLGANTLLRVKVKEEDAQSELEKFYGYLQWTREGMREFRFPIVLWVSLRMLREGGKRAPDFWSWRKAVLRFDTEDQRLLSVSRNSFLQSDFSQDSDDDDDELLPPLEEILLEIKEIKERSPDSRNLPTLYSKLGKIYAKRIKHGESKSLESDRSAAIEYFEKAIEGMKAIGDESAQMKTFRDLGNFLASQSQVKDAIQVHQQSLSIAQKLNNTEYVAKALVNLGNAYDSLGDYQKAIDFYSQSLEIAQTIGNKKGIASNLQGLGSAYDSLGDYQKSIDFHSQSLEIYQSIGNKKGIAFDLRGLGIAYSYLGDYQKSIDFHSQSLEVAKTIGDQSGIASSLLGLGNACCFVGDYQKSIEFYSQSLEIAQTIGHQSGIAANLANLGNVYSSLDDHQKSIEFYSQALEIKQTIGDKRGIAVLYFNMAYSQAKLDNHGQALLHYQKAKVLFEEMNIEYLVEQCKDAIRNCNIIIAAEPRPFPDIPKRKKKSMSREDRIYLGVVVGIVLVVLVWYLKR